MLTVSSIAHVAIRVKDVPRTLDFYVGKLGMREMMRLDREGSLWLLYLRITDSSSRCFPTAWASVRRSARRWDTTMSASRSRTSTSRRVSSKPPACR